MLSKNFFAYDITNSPEFAALVFKTIKKESYTPFNEQAFWAAGSIEEKLKTYLGNKNEAKVLFSESQKVEFGIRFVSSIVENIGIIEVRHLTKEHTASDLSLALEYFETQKIQKIVLDFRFNESADFESGIKFMEQLLPNNSPLFIHKSKAGTKIFKTNNTRLEKRNLQFYILQSSECGGMSEILTRLLKKHFYTKVIGQRSQGYALLSELVPVSNGFSIIVRKAEFTSLNKTSWHKKIIKPDVFVDTHSLNIKDRNQLINILFQADKSLQSRL